MPKPHSHIYDGKDEMRDELIAKVKTAARAKVFKKTLTAPQVANQTSLAQTTNKIVATTAQSSRWDNLVYLKNFICFSYIQENIKLDRYIL